MSRHTERRDFGARAAVRHPAEHPRPGLRKPPLHDSSTPLRSRLRLATYIRDVTCRPMRNPLLLGARVLALLAAFVATSMVAGVTASGLLIPAVGATDQVSSGTVE